MKIDTTKLTAVITTVVVLTVAVLISLSILPQQMLTPVVLAFISAIILYVIARDGQLLKEVESVRQVLFKNGDLLRDFSKIPHTRISRVRLIDNPKDHTEWFDFEKGLDVFNAPWTLASGPLYPALQKLLKQDGFKMRVLLFEGNDDESRTEYRSRLERLDEFAKKLLNGKIKIDGKIEVHIVKGSKSPTTTFFLSQKYDRKTSLLYVYPLIAGQKPMISLEINDEVSLANMTAHFEEFWLRGEVVPLVNKREN